jgi:hypothetical protein
MNPSSILRFLTCILISNTLFVSIGLKAAQSKILEPNLADIPAEHGWKRVNRSATVIDKEGRKAIRLEGKDTTGIAQIENFTFADGVIEFDARGKNVVQKSFLGVAFHGLDAKNYDAIYFRPFNFKADDATRRLHAVQYISPPIYTWQKLRSENPEHYEKSISPAPDPDNWFHVRVVVETPQVSVFVNGAPEPSLIVNLLNDRKSGWIGLWVDVGSGDFANLVITPKS